MDSGGIGDTLRHLCRDHLWPRPLGQCRGRNTRRQGVYLIGVACRMVAAHLRGWRRYRSGNLGLLRLSGGRKSLPAGGGGILLVLEGSVLHPSWVIHQLRIRLGLIYRLIKPVGVIGLASAWGFGVPFVVLLTNSMNSDYEFTYQAFQNSAVFPFVLFGTVTILVWLYRRFRLGWVPAIAVGLALTAQAMTYDATNSAHDVRSALEQVTPLQGAQLSKALAATSSNAEVIASITIIGRFSARPYIVLVRPLASAIRSTAGASFSCFSTPSSTKRSPTPIPRPHCCYHLRSRIDLRAPSARQCRRHHRRSSGRLLRGRVQSPSPCRIRSLRSKKFNRLSQCDHILGDSWDGIDQNFGVGRGLRRRDSAYGLQLVMSWT